MDVSRSHCGLTLVDVMSKGVVIAENVPILGGSITEDWVSGVRMTCSLNVEPSRDWTQWRELPNLEVRVFSGVDHVGSETLFPWGVFPVRVSRDEIPAKALIVQGSDRWQWTLSSDFPAPTESWPGEIRRVVADLVNNSQIYPSHAVVTATGQSWVQPVLWDKSKSETAITLAESIGAEVFYDRTGVPLVQNRTSVLGAPLSSDVVLSMSPQEDGDPVNVVTVSGSGQDAPSVTVAISNPSHPAYRWTLGYDKVKRISSNQVTTAEQARDAAMAALERESLRSLSWVLNVIPDASRAVGQVCDVSDLGLGVDQVATQKINFTLGPSPSMSLTVGVL